MKHDPACRVLVIDENQETAGLILKSLEDGGGLFAVERAEKDEDALSAATRARAAGQPFDAAFIAMGLPPAFDGLETAVRLWENDPVLVAVLCGGSSGLDMGEAARKLGTSHRWLFLKKPFSPAEFRQIALFVAQTQCLQRQAQAGLEHSHLLAEEVRRAAREQHRLLFDSNPIPLSVYDQTSLAFLAVNEAAVHLYGYSRDEFLAMTLADIAAPQDLPAFRERLSKQLPGAGNTGVWRHRVREGKFLEVEITAHALTFESRPAWLSMSLDVTARSALEAQLRQSQKMESVGQLASGIAHDFNNLLTVISGHAGMLLAGRLSTPKAADSIREISEATKRASALTRQLMTFSRKQELHLQVADLNEVVNNVGKMLRRILGEDIALTVDYAPGLPSIKADLGMLEQVLVNLAVNSRDAMPKGGQLLISTAATEVDSGQARLNPDAAPGRFVCLTFRDNGSGIAPQHLGRIFEPFFTTKELGHGTGLGLATVYGIVKQHQGWIQVNSRLGEGTTFHVYFPARQEKSVPLNMPAVEQRAIGGAETILLVEDEEPLLKLMHHILENYGYKVLDSSNGKTALEIWARYKNKIDLLLTDLVLPDGMSGRELAKTLQGEKAALKIVYTSGYDSARLARDFLPSEDVSFLEKPFHARKLAETVFDRLQAK